MKIFYRPEQSCATNDSYSPSAGKPAQVVADWLSIPAIADHIEVISNFNPATELDLIAAHDAQYVMGVLEGATANGFGNTNPDVARSLRYTTGSMLAAARSLVDKEDPNYSGDLIACSPTSGFHHAGFAWGGGFCTFNGLMATAIRLRQKGLVKRVLILDLDMHYGNGTQDIIDENKIDWITHITNGRGYSTDVDVDKLLQPESLAKLLDGIDLVLYQAGADIHVNDPLGGLLTTQGMRQRDKQIFAACLKHKVPCVWNLAGGYAKDRAGTIEPVLALHRQTMIECIKELEKQ